MSEYTIDVNGRRYELSDEFKDAIEKRARLEYEENRMFSCWWKEENGEPILVIETVGKMVPWDDLDQLEMQMGEPQQQQQTPFGRTHFALTPHRFEEIPDPGGEDPTKLPPEPKELDGNQLIVWVPDHPEVDVTWSAGKAMVPVDSWIEWNIQERANQPRPTQNKDNSHDAFESLCRIYDCELIGEAAPTNDIPKEQSGSVERKGERSFNEGKFGGDNWSV